MVTVVQMYNYCVEHNIKLLSDYTADFWLPYLQDSDKFDNIFKRLYKTYTFFDQEEDDDVEDVTLDFIQTVKDWLLVNHKRYSELFRPNLVDDNEYSILDNYDITETYEGTDNVQRANKYGQRTDINNLVVGSQNFTDVNKITAMNSNLENTDDTSTSSVGSRNDITQFTKGEQSDILVTEGADDHTMRRKGNIGVSTQTDVMKKHYDFWSIYNYYIKVFDEIASNFLSINLVDQTPWR